MKMSDKNEVRIIREGGQYHVFLGTTAKHGLKVVEADE